MKLWIAINLDHYTGDVGDSEHYTSNFDGLEVFTSLKAAEAYKKMYEKDIYASSVDIVPVSEDFFDPTFPKGILG